MTTNLLPCTLSLRLGNGGQLILQNKSVFKGRQVIIDASSSQITIADQSTISVSGQSLNTNGTQVRQQDGAQFVGQGGSCNSTTQNYTTFGNFDMIPDPTNLAATNNMIGSMGAPGDAETAGGGRIVIIADSIKMQGSGATLQANAMPYAQTAIKSGYSLVGGSGGYIYVNTKNLNNQNIIGNNFTVEAQGGIGANENYGGSGGVIVFDGGFSVNTFQVTAQGGAAINSKLNIDGCGNGAAGTLFYKSDGMLVIDNEHKVTVKKTVVTASKIPGGGPSILATSVQAVGHAQVWINAQAATWINFDNLRMTENVTIGFVTTSYSPFTLTLGNSAIISPFSLFDFSLVNFVNINATSQFANINLGFITYGSVLQIKGGNVKISGDVLLANPQIISNLQQSRVFIDTNSLTLNGNQTLKASYLFIHTQGSFQMSNGYNITSYVRASCSSQANLPVLFSCVPFKSRSTSLSQTNFLSTFSQFSGNQINRLEDIVQTINSGFQLYIYSENSIQISNSSINGPKIGMCAPDIYMNSSIITAAEKGCWAGQGIGKGQSTLNCSGSGGAHGGQGGAGLHYNTVQQCSALKSQGYDYGTQAMFEGSSGGSAVSGTNLGGNGGGIIWLSAINTVALNQSTVTVKGQDGLPFNDLGLGSGGGAGGSVQITTKNIAGDGQINLKGGNGSLFGGGGGSGGRIVTSLLQSYNSSNIIQQSLQWSGNILLDGGIGGFLTTQPQNLQTNILKNNNQTIKGGDGQSGTSTQDMCFGGFSGPFCKPCPIGTFKYNYGYGVCQPCENKPINSYYDAIAQSSAQCSFQCVDGFETVDVNADCLSSVDLQIQKLGGNRGFIVAIAFYFLLTLVILIIIAARSKCIRKSTKDYYSTVYDGVLFNESAYEQEQNEAMIGPASLQMRDSDIWSHTHRMYLIGENSISFPWFIPKDFPTNALSEQNKDRFVRFIRKDQWTLDWSVCQSYGYYFMRIFFPYISDFTHRTLRRDHYRKTSQKLYETFEQADWEDMTGRTLRISTDQDSRLAYIDFLDFRRTKSNYAGPKLPTTLLLAGNGTLSTPYNLNFLNDPLAKSLVYLNKEALQQKLPPFFQNLNTLLDKLCFYKFNRQTMKDLTDVIEWIELGNKTLFKQLNIKMVLYVFENSYQEVTGQEFRQRRRSMPLEAQVFETFPALFKKLIQHIQLKMLTKNSEIKLGLVVKSTSQQEKSALDQKIRQISESLGGDNDSILQFNQPAISQLYEEEQEDANDFVPQGNKKQSSLKGLNRKQELSEHLIQDEGMEESTVMFHGTDITTQIKIYDKSKRAFDISFESTKALEIILHKDRKRCKHSCSRIKSIFYSIWILMFKLHGKPPTDHLNSWFLLFSLALSSDILVTFVFLLHVMNPISRILNVGFAFIFILPGLTMVAPLWGLLGIIIGSPKMLKSYSSMNATMVCLNYPLTILVLWYTRDQSVYVAMILFLILNKMIISFFGSKVRQHFENPAFAKTQIKMREKLSDMLAQDHSGRTQGLTAAQRAAMLVSQGKPLLNVKDSDSDETFEIEEPDSFGIVSTKQLRPQQVQNQKEVKDQRKSITELKATTLQEHDQDAKEDNESETLFSETLLSAKTHSNSIDNHESQISNQESVYEDKGVHSVLNGEDQ